MIYIVRVNQLSQVKMFKHFSVCLEAIQNQGIYVQDLVELTDCQQIQLEPLFLLTFLPLILDIDFGGKRIWKLKTSSTLR